MDTSPLLDALVAHVPGLEVALVDPDGRCRLARGRRLDGGAGRPVAAVLTAPWQVPILQAVLRAADGEPGRGELLDPDDRVLVYATSAWAPVCGAALLTIADVTAERRARARATAATERFDAAFRHAPVAMTLLGPDLVPVDGNAAARELSGGGGAPREPGRIFDVLDPAEVTELMDGARSLIRGERAGLSMEHTLVRADGRRLRVRSHARPVTLEDGRPGALVHSVDISSEAGLADELRRLTTDDPLTGVLNRHGLEAALAATPTAAAPMTLLLADVDDFAAVNDALGPARADLVLRDVADALRATVRDTDAVARTGGDEFAVLLPGLDVTDAGRVAEAILERLRGGLVRGGGDAAQLGLTVSIGLTSVTPHTSLDTALAGAGIAVYAAQQAGPGRWMAGL